MGSATLNEQGMSSPRLTALVVGATGSIGRLVVEEAVRKGHAIRALARDPRTARRLFPDVEVVAGDLTRPDTLTAAVDGVDAIVFTHGSDGGGKAGAEGVDYGGVRSVLAALGGRAVRIALMTAIGVTNRDGDYNRQTEAHDWKRRGERLVRASGLPSHDRATRLVRLQQARRASTRTSPGGSPPRRRFQRRGHRASPTCRGLGRQPDICRGAAQKLRTRRHPRPGTTRP